MKLSDLYPMLLVVSVVSGCAPTQPPAPAASAGAEQSILAKSNPGAGSTDAAPLDKLELWFNPPARLSEVTVSGPEGMMPMMVSPVGEVGYYSLPVSASTPGDYTVGWRASVAGREHEGSFRFVLR